MKTLIVVCFLFSSLVYGAGETGLGISLGNPTGLNVKRWLDNKAAVDGGLGLSVGRQTNGSVHSDYLLHSQGALFVNDVHPLDVYYGLGARMEFADDIELGVRVPIGVAHRQENNGADIFGEAAPIFNLFGAAGIELHVLFGARYYF